MSLSTGACIVGLFPPSPSVVHQLYNVQGGSKTVSHSIWSKNVL